MVPASLGAAWLMCVATWMAPKGGCGGCILRGLKAVDVEPTMNLPTKQNLLQSYQVVVYNRALHPDLFTLKGRRVVRQGEYDLEAWIMPGQHLLRFEHRNHCCVELLTHEDRPVPTAGIVTSFLCAGERDVEQPFKKEGLNYMSTVQTETLSENLYQSTYDELAGFARENNALSHAWTDDVGKCLSFVDIQRMNREVHCQAYHLVASNALVLRIQTIVEHA